MGGIRASASQPAAKVSAAKPERGIDDMRRLSNLLVGLCAVLFITSFILGAGLLQSDNRLSAMEEAIVTMDSNHLVIADQIRQLAAVAAFAPQEIDPSASNTANQTQTSNQSNTPQDQQTQSSNQPNQQAQVTPPPQPPASDPDPPPQSTDQIGNQSAFSNVPETYTIQPGDSLLQISRMFFGDTGMVSRIMELNNISDPDLINIGQVLTLPRD
jgi:LysM repeat protein